MKKIVFTSLLVFLSTLMVVVLSEALLLIMSWSGVLPVDPPYYSFSDVGKPLAGMHFKDVNRYFGPWHDPGVTYIHRIAGKRLEYSFNSYGARDVERTVKSETPRAIMLGDSFVEGYALKTSDRLSNIIEQSGCVDTLNFGVAGNTGTTNYLLIYKNLAEKFDHKFLLVGILPSNDFLDNDYDVGRQTCVFRYRPYLVGTYPDYKLVYFNQSYFDSPGATYPMITRIRSFMVNFSMTYKTASFMKHLIIHKTSNLSDQSWYYDFSEKDWLLMKYTVEQLASLAAARNVKMLVFTIPVLGDVLRYQKDGEAPLSKHFSGLAYTLQIEYIDLLPGFSAEVDTNRLDQTSQALWLRYDGHWTSKGNQLAFKIMGSTLSSMGMCH